jgi:hypothetical protein
MAYLAITGPIRFLVCQGWQEILGGSHDVGRCLVDD